MKTVAKICTLIMGVAACTSVCAGRQLQSDQIVRLSKNYPGNASHPNVTYRALGSVNQLEHDPNQDDVFDPCTSPCCDENVAGFIGDRLGYDASGLYDVDGDGYNDWVETWYFAEPKRPGLSGAERVPANAANMVILPPYYVPASPFVAPYYVASPLGSFGTPDHQVLTRADLLAEPA